MSNINNFSGFPPNMDERNSLLCGIQKTLQCCLNVLSSVVHGWQNVPSIGMYHLTVMCSIIIQYTIKINL